MSMTLARKAALGAAAAALVMGLVSAGAPSSPVTPPTMPVQTVAEAAMPALPLTSGGTLTKAVAAQRPAAAKKAGWFAEARSILNRVGGKKYPLAKFNGQCGKVRAVACSYFDGTIKVASGFAKRTMSRKVWTMTHEVAHQYQIKIWGKLMKSKKYKTMFRSNPELLANCMASARGATDHGHYCSKAMVKAAAKVWKGKTP